MIPQMLRYAQSSTPLANANVMQLQWKHGVDAVIVDKVLAIGKELRPPTEDETSGNGDILSALKQAKDVIEASTLNTTLQVPTSL